MSQGERKVRLLIQALRVVRELGPGWALYRLLYALQRRSGWLAYRMPAYAWEDRPLRTWLHLDVPAQPDAYAAWREEHGGRFFPSTGLRAEALKAEGSGLRFDDVARARWTEALREIQGAGQRDLLDEAEAVLAGRWRYFAHREVPVGLRPEACPERSRRAQPEGFPPDWSRNPLNGVVVPSTRHWSRISDFGHGDIKLVWEASRFAVAYTLVRAYWVSGDERYPAAFWTLIEDWRRANPPQRGPNWKSGQEAAFRIMAWCFALYGFAGSPHTTPERLAMLAEMIAAHANRIEGNIAYARSQKSNHAISEAVGLWMVGLLFPEFGRAERWRELGRRVLEEEAQRQIYPDGSYVQHSTNYHRLMLHDYLWAIRLGELNGYPLSDGLQERVCRAVGFLYQLQDEKTGQVPCYGANDGALILPLNICDYQGYRPVLAAGHYLCHGERLYPLGPWDEDLLWLFGPEALQAPVKARVRTSLTALTGGYFTLRGEDGFGFVRCATYRDRPGQADMLHFDLWWRGINVACDAGTYSYNGPLPWNNGLAATEVHNTMTVDGLDQMERGPHFLWFGWTKSQVRFQARSDRGWLEYFEGEHYGYRRLPQSVTHRRAVVRVGDNVWLVVDDMLGEGVHRFRLHWLLPDLEHDLDEGTQCLVLHTEQGDYGVWLSYHGGGSTRISLVRGADKGTTRGWRSPYYSVRVPALSLALESTCPTPCRYVTFFAPVAETSVRIQPANRVTIRNDHLEGLIQLSAPGDGTGPILQRAVMSQGGLVDTLQIGGEM